MDIVGWILLLLIFLIPVAFSYFLEFVWSEETYREVCIISGLVLAAIGYFINVWLALIVAIILVIGLFYNLIRPRPRRYMIG